MPARIAATIDRRVAGLLVAWARRRWPALRWVPDPLVRLAAAREAPRVRRAVTGHARKVLPVHNPRSGT